MIAQSYSIRQRIWLVTACVLFIMSCLVFWSAGLYGERAARISYDRQLMGSALQMAENVNLVDGEIEIDLPVSAFEMLSMAKKDRAFYSVATVSGDLLTGYSDLPKPLHPDEDKESKIQYYDAVYSGELTRFIQVTKRLLDRDFDNYIVLTLGQTILARAELAHEMRLFVVQFVIVIFLVSLSLILMGVWFVLRPLKQIRKELDSRSSVDLSPISLIVPREITPLIRSINFFMAQLQLTLERLKRFSSEAAHQLRTPLAGLSLEAQSALTETNEQARNEQLGNIVSCSSELTIMISQLLSRADLVHRFQSDENQQVHFSALVVDVCRDIAITALKDEVEIAYLSEGAELKLHGNEYALRQMVRNLLENAIKYSPMFAIVEVELLCVGNQALLQVRDTGQGIKDEEKERVLEYFYRGSNNLKPGTGIGLAIAQEIAQHHNATLSLKDNEPSGLIVEVAFPREGEYES